MSLAVQSLLDLRKEADNLKQCFTELTFKAVAFSSAALGLLIQYGQGRPWLHVSAGMIALLVLGVARLGIHKFATANRIYGFQLFVERLQSIDDASRNELTQATLKIGWEEAMRAWRIVQTSVFAALYHGKGMFPRNHPTARNKRTKSQAWWDVNRLMDLQHEDRQGPPAVYHAGSFLATMLAILIAFALLSMVIVVVGYSELRDRLPSPDPHSFALALWWTGAFGVGLFILFCAYNIGFVSRRRKMLESELLSIHSCSIMWEVVVVAHLRARRKQRDQHLQGYTKCLTEEVASLLAEGQLEHIHDWVKPRNSESPPASVPPAA